LKILTSLLEQGANTEWDLNLDDRQLAQFTEYAELMIEWNATRMNLTRLISPQDIVIKHFLDSLALLKLAEITEGASLLDLGTGAGLPGIALKIARPDLHLVLMDGTAKKLTFCRAVCDRLSLSSVEFVHARAEDAERQPTLLRHFDYVVARAVAPLERLLPWCEPFVRPGGFIVAYKGASGAAEMSAARPIARRLGLTLLPIKETSLPISPDTLVRTFLLARKASAESLPGVKRLVSQEPASS
jgi:16S rRNA (guanine527-N7)-methyltransferase